MEGSVWLSERDRLLLSEDVDMVNLGFEGRPPGCSMGWPWEPMGVASDSFGAPPLDARENRGISAGFSAS